jgi:importin-7
MNYCNTLLTSSPSPALKYALFSVLSTLSEPLQASEQFSPFLLPMLTNHVIPELSSQHDYLKSKSCDTLTLFSTTTFPPETLNHILQVLTSLLSHPQLSCRVSAGLCLGPLFKYDLVQIFVREHVVQIMQVLLTLTEQIQIDPITSLMEVFVEQFGAGLSTFAQTVSQRLVQAFMEMVGDEDRVLAAAGVIKTLDGLVVSLEGEQVVAQLEGVLVPLVVFVIDNTIMDLYEEVLELISTLVYCGRSVSETLWGIFPRLISVTEDLEYLEDVYPLLDNYIGFGAAVMVQNREIQAMLVQLVQRVMEDKDCTESDRIRAMLIMESMMLNLRGGIDHVSIWGL